MDFNSLNVSVNNNAKTSYSSVNESSGANNRIKTDGESYLSDTQKSAVEYNKKIRTNSSSEKIDAAKLSKAYKTDDKSKETNNEESSGVIYKGNFEESLEKAVEMANKKLFAVNRQFSYAIHEQTKKVMLKIKDSETGEVIKEIPSEKDLDLFAKLQELAGILVDEKR